MAASTCSGAPSPPDGVGVCSTLSNSASLGTTMVELSLMMFWYASSERTNSKNSGVLPERLGVDAGGLGVGLAANLLGLAARLVQQDGLLAVGLGANLFGLLLAFGAVLPRDALALGLHAAEHRLLVLRRKIEPA